ncbi:uncharacterized protein LOC144767348 [Lissotriton helveticus]
MWKEARSSVQGLWKQSCTIREQAGLPDLLQPLEGPSNLRSAEGPRSQEAPLCRSLSPANLQPGSMGCGRRDKTATYPLMPIGQRSAQPRALGTQGSELAASGVLHQRDLGGQVHENMAIVHNVPESFIHICATDLLLEAQHRKRPRLLPPHRKMHLEVPHGRTEHPPAVSEQQHTRGQESQLPLEYRHLMDTMSLLKPTDISQVEMLYRQFTPWPRQALLPPCSHASPPKFTPYARGGAGSQQQLRVSSGSMSRHRRTPKSAQESHLGHLPPKKRFPLTPQGAQVIL